MKHDSLTKRVTIWAIAIALLLTIPLVLTLVGSGIDGVGWHWTFFDFVFMGTLLFGSALAYELIVRKVNNSTYRIAAGIAAVTVVLLVWINAAVGIIGDEGNPANLIYFGVLLVGLIGASVSFLEPKGMSYTMFTMALAQMLVPVVAFIIWRPQLTLPPGIAGVFALNAVFAILWAVSGILFRRAHMLIKSR